MSRPITGWTIPPEPGEMACYQVQWPAGREWAQFLVDILYSLTRGRSWAADTGTITDAQRWAWDVFNANFPLTDCAGETVVTEYVYVPCGTVPGSGDGDDEEDDEVAGVQKIEVIPGGLRVWYGQCPGCYYDLVLEGVSDQIPPEPETDEELVVTDAEWGTACTQATALVAYHAAIVDALLGAIAQVIVDEGDVYNANPWSVYSLCSQVDTSVKLGMVDFLGAWQYSIEAVVLGLQSELESPNWYAEMRDIIQTRCPGGPVGMSQDDYESAKNLVDHAAQERFGDIIKYPVISVWLPQIHKKMFSAIGAKDASRLTSRLMLTGTEDCEYVPEVAPEYSSLPDFPEAFDADTWWVVDEDFTDGDNDGGFVAQSGRFAYTAGVGWQYNADALAALCARNVIENQAGTLKYIYAKVRVVADADLQGYGILFWPYLQTGGTTLNFEDLGITDPIGSSGVFEAGKALDVAWNGNKALALQFEAAMPEGTVPQQMVFERICIAGIGVNPYV